MAIIDQVVPRSDLGVGVYSLSLEVKEAWQRTVQELPEETPPVPPPGRGVASGTQVAEADEKPVAVKVECAAATGASEEPPVKRQKTCLEQAELDAASTSDASHTLEQLAASIKQAFAHGLIYSEDVLNPTTVCFLLRAFATVHLEQAKPTWPKGKAPMGAVVFSKFVVMKLLSSESSTWLPHLIPHLRKLRALDDAAVTTLVHA